MREIRLTRGQVTLVDDWNYEWLNQWKWCSLKARSGYYATRGVRQPDGKVQAILMHRLILGLKEGDKKCSDHKDGNGLDNRESNIRVCTYSENAGNQKPQKRQTSSIYKGVSWHQDRKKWRSYININGKIRHLGGFKNEKVAALIYDLNARKHFGQFAACNF